MLFRSNVVDKGLIGMDINTKSSGDTALLSELSGDIPSKITKPSNSKTSKQCKGDRPVGTTVKTKEERKSNIFKAKNEITKRFSAAKRK